MSEYQRVSGVPHVPRAHFKASMTPRPWQPAALAANPERGRASDPDPAVFLLGACQETGPYARAAVIHHRDRSAFPKKAAGICPTQKPGPFRTGKIFHIPWGGGDPRLLASTEQMLCILRCGHQIAKHAHSSSRQLSINTLKTHQGKFDNTKGCPHQSFQKKKEKTAARINSGALKTIWVEKTEKGTPLRFI